ncbi:MAG: zf-HC2 domain-containing protein, partial [Gemmatimonadetes bacterium]|nr:zf-HC2 domain-containing protein [Gemmatimonadota bacterium]
MIGLRRHPAWHQLNRLADGELDADSRARVMAHVVSCSKCPQSLSFVRRLGEAGRDMKHPSPPKNLLAEVLQHRSEGDRVILPAASPSSRRKRRLLPAAAAAAIIVGLGVASLTLTPEVGAGASELKFFPPQPVPGERIRVEYRPGVELTGETALRLRLRLRQSDDEPPRGVLGTLDELVLEPDGDGRFVGNYQLPPDFAYAAFAVENLAGDRLDDRQGHFWSVRAHT